MELRKLLVLAAAFGLCAAPAFANEKEPQPELLAGSITVGTVGWALNAGTFSSTSTGPTHNFTIAGQDQVFQDWWWYRLGTDAREFTFPMPATSETYVGNTATITWNNLNGSGLNAVLTVVISENPARAVHTMAITNANAAPVDLAVMRYVDFDLNATASSDNAALVTSPSLMTVSEGARVFRFQGQGASNFAVSTFSTLRGTLADADIDNMADTGLPFGPGDYTGGYQWASQPLAAGATRNYVTVYGEPAQFTLTTNSPQTVNAVVGGSVQIPITATVVNPDGGTYTVGVVGDSGEPPIDLSQVSTYIGFGPGGFLFQRTCTPTVRGVFQRVKDIQATQTSGVPGPVNPVTASNVTWICQTPSDLTLTVTEGGGGGRVGVALPYTFSYANASAQATEGVVLTTTVPVNSTFTAAGSTAGWSCANGAPAGTVCTLAIGAVGASPASGSAIFVVTPTAAAEGGNLSITGSIADDGVGGADIVPGNNSASDTTGIGPPPSQFTLTTNSPQTVNAVVGTSVPVPITATIANLDGGTYTVTIPSHAAFPPISGSTIVTYIGFPPGNFLFQRTCAPTVRGQFQAVQSIQATQTGGLPSPITQLTVNNVTWACQTPSDLTLAITDGGASGTVGVPLVYTLNYANASAQATEGVLLSVTVPVNSTFASAGSTAGWSCANGAPAGTVCTLAVGAVGAAPANGSATFAVTPLAGAANGNLSITASIADDGVGGADLVPANNTASDTTGVVASADLSVTLVASPAQVAPGQALTFTATVTNGGPSPAENVQVAVALGGGVLFAAAAPSAGGSCITPAFGSGGVVTCTWPGTTAMGAARSVLVTAYREGAGSATATATASSATSDPTPANDSASASVNVALGGLANPPTVIPTNSPTILALLAMLLGAIGFVAVRRRI